MLQVRIHGPDDVRLDDVPEPKPGPRDALVRVRACGICGSDLGYIELGGVAGPVREPMPLGHELSGVIEAVGADVDGFAIGERVVVNPTAAQGGAPIGNGGSEGGFAPLLLVRNAAAGKSLFRVPDSVPLELAALSEPLGVGMNAVDKSAAQPGEKVVIFGAGPIGLAAMATLRQRDVDDVVCVDLSEHRLRIARSLGARATLNAGEGDVWTRLRELHGEAELLGTAFVGSDVYIEASGASPIIPQVIANCRRGARLSVVALHRREIPTNFLLLLMKELQINGAMEYPDDYGLTLDVLEQSDVSPMVSHRFPLERFDEALAVARDTSVSGKVLVEME